MPNNRATINSTHRLLKQFQMPVPTMEEIHDQYYNHILELRDGPNGVTSGSYFFTGVCFPFNWKKKCSPLASESMWSAI